MKTKIVKISEVKLNPNNPRIIKDDKFRKLVKSIQEFPEMLDIRPIVVNGDMVVLGGNMRYKACKEAGLKEIPIIMADHLTEEQAKQFIIKDNVSGGEWDWEMLHKDWNIEEVKEWGVDVWTPASDINLDDFFSEDNQKEEKEQKFQIVLDYTEEEYNMVIEKFSDIGGTKESVVFKLLGL